MKYTAKVTLSREQVAEILGRIEDILTVSHRVLAMGKSEMVAVFWREAQKLAAKKPAIKGHAGPFRFRRPCVATHLAIGSL
jgi:hypothetical protein